MLHIFLLALSVQGPTSGSTAVTTVGGPSAPSMLKVEGDAPYEPIRPLSTDERECAAALVPEAAGIRDKIRSLQAESAAVTARSGEVLQRITEVEKEKAEAGKAKEKAEAEKAKAEKAKAEAERARERAEAEKAKPGADKAKAEAAVEKAKAALEAAKTAMEAALAEVAKAEAARDSAGRTLVALQGELLANEAKLRELEEHAELKLPDMDRAIGRAYDKNNPFRARFHLKRQLRRCERGLRNARIEAQIEKESRTFRSAMRGARQGRCGTALCWGPSYKFAFEPLAELPIGKNFAFPNSSLARYVNSTDVQITFNAGVRFWMAWDWVSIAVYLSKPILHQGETIHVSGASTSFSTSQVRRPYPGVGVGLFGDLLWISFDYDQLRNGNSGALYAPEFRPNEVVSHAYTFSFAIAPIAGIRNGLGLGTVAARDAREQEAKQKAEAAKKEAEAQAAAKAAAEKAVAEKAAAEKAAAEKAAAEKAAAEKAAAEKAAAEKAAAEKAAAEKPAAPEGGP